MTQTSSPNINKLAPNNNKHKLVFAFLIALLIIICTLAAYRPVLFNCFVGDDFVHLDWLHYAISNPHLLVKNFYSSWLDGTTTKFYRPLISVFMYTDYLLWGVNGLGFRLTNLAFHLVSSGFIFIIFRKLLTYNQSNKVIFFCPFFASFLFALYPLHPEAVSWITGRVDSIVTTFCLASFAFYIYWRNNKSPWMFGLASISMILALLSKEMAITIPAVFFLFSILYENRTNLSNQTPSIEINPQLDASSLVNTTSLPSNTQKSIDTTSNTLLLFGQHFLTTCKTTLPFWLLLGAYFILRRLALGTFVGGYDNSLFFVPNLSSFFGDWFHALRIFIVPLNKSLISSHHILTMSWISMLILVCSLIVYQFITNKELNKHLAFLFLWLILCLAPVYKIFAIADDLQGSRLAYLATVPLCMILATAFYGLEQKKVLLWKKWLLISSAAVFLTLNSIILWFNNHSWLLAGQENNYIRLALQKLYQKIDGDPQVLLLGLPDQINGAYTCRNSLTGMTKFPQLNRNINNCLAISSYEPILPFGFLKDSIYENKQALRLFSWDTTKKDFVPIYLDNQLPTQEICWSGSALKDLLKEPAVSINSLPAPQITYLQDGSYKITTSNKLAYLDLHFHPTSCWNIDFIEMSIDPKTSNTDKLYLLYKNNLNRDFSLPHRSQAAPDQNGHVIFALGGLPEWSLGGQFSQLRLLIPAHKTLIIRSIGFVNKEKVTPIISFANSGYFGQKGFLHLGPGKLTAALQISCKQIPDVATLELEITRANLLFDTQNAQTQSAVKWKVLPVKDSNGNVTLYSRDFPTPGMYELRAWTRDNKGNIIGLSSNHIVLSVDCQ